MCSQANTEFPYEVLCRRRSYEHREPDPLELDLAPCWFYDLACWRRKVMFHVSYSGREDFQASKVGLILQRGARGAYSNHVLRVVPGRYAAILRRTRRVSRDLALYPEGT